MTQFWNESSESHFQPPGNHRDYLEALSRVAGKPAHRIGKVLDFGCNRAWACGLFDDYVGIDQNEQGIAAARAYWPKHKAAQADQFVQMPEGARLPFEGSSFDLVFAKDVFEHLHDPLGTLMEFRRVLRPGGWVFMCSPDAQRWAWNDPTHVRPFPRAAQRALAQMSGFRLVSEGYESVAPGTQKIARILGRGRTPFPMRMLVSAIPIWPRNAWSVLQRRAD